MENLILRIKEKELSIYEIDAGSASKKNTLQRFIASTPQSRRITNDPLCIGCEYTELLEDACSVILEGVYPVLSAGIKAAFEEKKTSVLHVLRGGLNFGLRNALHRSYGWNIHRSTYVSAQRKRKEEKSEDWCITETNYQKPSFPEIAFIVCGDVVATGTSLEYAFSESIRMAQVEAKEISGFMFFTIGGIRSEEILLELEKEAQRLFPSYAGSVVIYLEGRFLVPDIETPLSIKETGTDLVRRESLLSLEFIQSQFENPLYPLERCTIYDAGSRSFSYSEYLQDVLEYWEKVQEVAVKGVSFQEYLNERFPELLNYGQFDSFETLDLRELAEHQIRNIKTIFSTD